MQRRQAAHRNTTLIFLHILKTGGTTLNYMLEQYYAPAESFSTFPSRRDPNGSIEAFEALGAEDKARIRLLYGHMGFGLHEQLPGPTVYTTLLRDPVKRVISRYYHEKREPKSQLYQEVRAGMSLEEYVYYSAAAAKMDNLQTRMIAGNWRYRGDGPCTAEMLAQAKDNLHNHFLLAGLTRYFDEFYLLLCRHFGWRWTFYLRRQVTGGRPRPQDLSPETLALIKKYNAFDIELCTHAHEIFVEQLQKQDARFWAQLRLYRLLNGAYTRYWKLRSFSLRQAVRKQWHAARA